MWWVLLQALLQSDALGQRGSILCRLPLSARASTAFALLLCWPCGGRWSNAEPTNRSSSHLSPSGRHCHRWHAHLRATPSRHFHGAFPLSIVVYLFAARPLVDNATYTRARLTKATSIGPLDNRFRFEIFGVSLLLLVGLTVGECAFNFMNFHFAYDGMTPDQSLSFNYPYHVARALGALSCFIFVGLLRIPYKRFFWIGIMTMCGAFAIAPFLEALGLPAYFSNYVNQACFAIVAIFEVAVFCEISYARQTYPLESVGFGMVFITGFIVPGLLLGMFTASLHLTNSQYEMLTAVAGYAVILGLWAAVSEGQRYLDPKQALPLKPAENALSTSKRTSPRAIRHPCGNSCARSENVQCSTSSFANAALLPSRTS
ncbi:MAG: hypothetical protein ACLSGS_10665 [Adlercreutzia sp.]